MWVELGVGERGCEHVFVGVVPLYGQVWGNMCGCWCGWRGITLHGCAGVYAHELV